MSSKVQSIRPFSGQESPSHTPTGSDSNGNEADIEKSYSEGPLEPSLHVKAKSQEVEGTEDGRNNNLCVMKPRSFSTGSSDSRETCLHIPHQHTPKSGTDSDVQHIQTANKLMRKKKSSTSKDASIKPYGKDITS